MYHRNLGFGPKKQRVPTMDAESAQDIMLDYFAPSPPESQPSSFVALFRSESEIPLTMSQQLTPPCSPTLVMPDAPRPNKRPIADIMPLSQHASSSNNTSSGGGTAWQISPSYRNPFAQPAGVPAKRELKNLSGGAPSRLLTDFRLETNTAVIQGQGGKSAVYFAQHRLDGLFYAVKVISKGPDTRVDDLREVQALAAVGRHANVVGYHASWLDGEQIWMQLEKCDSTLGADIAAAKPYSLEDFARLARDLACGLAHVHGSGIAHLDVKPDNIFYRYTKEGKQFKIGDFGQAQPLHAVSLGDEGDSNYYRALGATASGQDLDMYALSRSLLDVPVTFSWQQAEACSSALIVFVTNPAESTIITSKGPLLSAQLLLTEVTGLLAQLEGV